MWFYEESSSSDESEQNSGDDYIEDSVQKGGVKRKRVSTGAAARKSPRKPKTPPKPSYVAKVIETATAAADMSEDASKVDRIDSSVLARIRKAMELATHPGTGEAEAKVAMRIATKLVASQNITQADLIANETAEERSTRAGNSRVRITSTASKMVRNQRWYEIASDAVCEAFDVQVYSETGFDDDDDDDSLDWVFYGLADNTVAAALAFEMLLNQIELWAIENKRELKGRTAPNSYRIGVSERVLKDTKRANRQALKQAEEIERKRQRDEAAAAEDARAAEIARLAMPSGTVEEESKPKVKVEDVPDDEFSKPAMPIIFKSVKFEIHMIEMLLIWHTIAPSSDIDDSDPDDDDSFAMDYANSHWEELDGYLHADFESNRDAPDDFDLDALEEKIKIKTEMGDLLLGAPQHRRHTSPTLPEVKMVDPVEVKSVSINDAPIWSSALQLRTFQDNARTIAENYLKDSGVKLYKGRKRAEIKLDASAYSKGWDDGKKVDLKRRRIEGQA